MGSGRLNVVKAAKTPSARQYAPRAIARPDALKLGARRTLSKIKPALRL